MVKKLDNKLILPTIAAIIVIGTIGMFYAITLDQNDFEYDIQLIRL